MKQAITLGALAHFSQAISMKRSEMVTAPGSPEHLASLDSNLVNRATDGTTTRIGNMMNSASSLARSAADAGLQWFGWYSDAVVDATADLVSDALSDADRWYHQGTGATRDFIEELVGDAD